MSDTDTFASLNEELSELKENASSATGVVATFTEELGHLRGQMLYSEQEVKSLSGKFGTSIKNAFDGVVFEGDRLSDTLRNMAKSMLDASYSAAVKPVQDALGGVVAGGMNGLLSKVLPFEKGGALGQGRVIPFARGGVVSSPTPFPMRGATGLMGEAGPEAIMPLTRGPDGSLGVRANGAGGGRAVNVVMNISTPDVTGFRRSQTQIAAEMNRALARGRRNQ